MVLAKGTKLGPYKLASALGVGGMGEVYRAHDARLGRDVAVKIIPRALATDRSRVARFEQEARAAAALNHPNILAVYDIGWDNGSPYVVSELLEGDTLRKKLVGGPLPVRKSIEYGLQIVRGLAAAHDKRIVHRDLKPENIFITREGQAKILDFGLAKLVRSDASSDATLTRTIESDAGTVVGTIGYMSPEQVRGRSADGRTDLFSFGAVLYEMLSGERAFKGDSVADTLSAILHENPPALAQPTVSPALDRIVRLCLEKDPDERFHSAHDVALALDAISVVAIDSPVPSVGAARKNWRSAAALLTLLSIGLGFVAGRTTVSRVQPPTFRQLTFRRGYIESAATAPDGHTVLYGANWDNEGMQTYSTRDDGQGSIPVGLRNVRLLSISANGELAVLQDYRVLNGWTGVGTLARVSLNGGGPRPVMEDVADIAWNPNGSDFAVVRLVGGRFRLEYPIGKALYSTAGWISYPRFSPNGDRIAFLDHPELGDDRGSVSVIDLTGHRSVLTGAFTSEAGLAWSSSADEIWFTAGDEGPKTELLATTLKGRRRTLISAPGRLILEDIIRNGSVLLRHESFRRGTFVLAPGATAEKDVAVMDWNVVRAISPDGQYVVSSEEGQGGGAKYSIYLRKTDGSPPIRLGEGNVWDLSPDQKWVAATDVSEHPQIWLLPTGAGQPRRLTHDLVDHAAVSFFPDGKRIAFLGVEPGGQPRTYVQDIEGGAARAITPPGISAVHVSTTGSLVLVRSGGAEWWLYPVEGGKPQRVSGIGAAEDVAGWAADGESIFVYEADKVPSAISRVDPRSGRRVLLKEITPSDPAGLLGIGPVYFTPDGKHYVYGLTRLLDDLYSLTGLK